MGASKKSIAARKRMENRLAVKRQQTVNAGSHGQQANVADFKGEDCSILLESDDNDDKDVLEQSSEASFEKKLINLVQNARPLWDTGLPLNSRSRFRKEQLWQQIKKDMGDKYSIKYLQSKWNNLKKQYVRAKSRMTDNVANCLGVAKRKPWKYYEALNFISEIVDPGSTASNVNSVTSDLNSPPTSSDALKRLHQDLNRSASKGEAGTTPSQKINPICLQLSNILNKLPIRVKADLEIKFLTEAYDALHEENILWI